MNHNYSLNGDRCIEIPTDILNDLSSRFIVNVPEEERNDVIRVFFQVELAHWFYLDFYCNNDPDLPTCSIREFGRIIFNHIPFLRKHLSEIDNIISKWRSYKSNVPTFGAILLNESMDKILLVQSFAGKASWGFPKGKVNKEEDPHICAAREVFEEVGFDISSKIDRNRFIEHRINDRIVRLYIISGISEETVFQPRTRNEIKDVGWFHISDFAPTKKGEQSKLQPNNFYMVLPFIRKLKRWIADQQSSNEESFSSPETVTEDACLPSPVDKSVNRQQQLFAQLAANEFSNYLQLKGGAPRTPEKSHEKCSSPVERYKDKKYQIPTDKYAGHYNNHNARPFFTPPPRFLKMVQQKAPENVRSKTFYPSSELKEKPTVEVTVTRKALGTEKKPSRFRCTAWDNFRLDIDAMVAAFDITLRAQDL